MADILIRGMEMPRDCPMCKLAHFNRLDEFTGCDAVSGKRYVPHSDGQFWNSAERPKWCPLVPLPEGHGRLIDADKLYEVAKTRSMGIYGPCNYQCVITGNDILKAPTIIPAEGGTDNV